ncbi:MAG: DUF2237 domain-containing protein [Lentisphaeria bacterium]|nr:DUF2237 domain-containing protein [Lentisphaeria bacterium]NQZ68675.1 DUF2237 domain-containing protein [Lentisphaeria bacterium]
MALNVFGENLECCCNDPMTGFYRNGSCDTGPQDQGMHTVCVEITESFLESSAKAGNDLSTAMPEYNFPGLKEGDRWCLCLYRWVEAYDNGFAPRVYLKGTHITALEHLDLETLSEFSLDDDQSEA